MSKYLRNLLKRKPENEISLPYLNLFIQRWQEAVTWVEVVTPKNGSKLMRSKELEPDNLLTEVSTKEQERILNKLTESRKYFLDENNIPLTPLDNIITKGYLLVTEIDYTLVDGASEAESNCFIDRYDTPPWDTWVWLEDYNNVRLLYSWVPHSKINYVEGAIAVNCVDMIHWASKTDTPITLNLKHLNLLKDPQINEMSLDYSDQTENIIMIESMLESILKKNKNEHS